MSVVHKDDNSPLIAFAGCGGKIILADRYFFTQVGSWAGLFAFAV
jgi:hypothetical protein